MENLRLEMHEREVREVPEAAEAYAVVVAPTRQLSYAEVPRP